MGYRVFNKMAIRAKVEVTPGTDAAPTGALNAMDMFDVKLTPLAADELKLDYMRPYFGDTGFYLVGQHVQLEASAYLVGSGTKGTAPAYGPLLRACGLAETIVAATSVTYQPASAAQEAVTIYTNIDGVNHKMMMTRGSAKLDLKSKDLPKLTFNFKGLLGVAADEVLPQVTLTAFKAPVPVSKDNTTITLFGGPVIAESLSFDVGNTVEARHLIGAEAIVITDRASKMEAVLQADLLAAKNWFALAQAGTKGAISVVHGTAAGFVATLAAPSLQVGQPAYGQTQGITNVTLPLRCITGAGDDEFSLAFT